MLGNILEECGGNNLEECGNSCSWLGSTTGPKTAKQKSLLMWAVQPERGGSWQISQQVKKDKSADKWFAESFFFCTSKIATGCFTPWSRIAEQILHSCWCFYIVSLNSLFSEMFFILLKLEKISSTNSSMGVNRGSEKCLQLTPYCNNTITTSKNNHQV